MSLSYYFKRVYFVVLLNYIYVGEGLLWLRGHWLCSDLFKKSHATKSYAIKDMSAVIIKLNRKKHTEYYNHGTKHKPVIESD